METQRRNIVDIKNELFPFWLIQVELFANTSLCRGITALTHDEPRRIANALE
jgi:hypothetical protein